MGVYLNMRVSFTVDYQYRKEVGIFFCREYKKKSDTVKGYRNFSKLVWMQYVLKI